MMNVDARADTSLIPMSRAESNPSRVSRRISPGEEEKEESAPARRPERKKLTLFRFESKLGDISVQPVMGSVNGAQFSLGF